MYTCNAAEADSWRAIYFFINTLYSILSGIFVSFLSRSVSPVINVLFCCCLQTFAYTQMLLHKNHKNSSVFFYCSPFFSVHRMGIKCNDSRSLLLFNIICFQSNIHVGALQTANFNWMKFIWHPCALQNLETNWISHKKQRCAYRLSNNCWLLSLRRFFSRCS